MNKEVNVNIAPLGFSLESIGVILGIIFTTLKLCHVGDVANWSWFWVTFPFWICAAVGLGLFILTMIVIGIVALVSTIKDR